MGNGVPVVHQATDDAVLTVILRVNFKCDANIKLNRSIKWENVGNKYFYKENVIFTVKESV